MPVKVHLENPFLGKSCFVGSEQLADQIGTDHRHDQPAAAQQTDHRHRRAKSNSSKKRRILKLKGTELVDNAWSAPAASGCGGILSFLVNPIINAPDRPAVRGRQKHREAEKHGR